MVCLFELTTFSSSVVSAFHWNEIQLSMRPIILDQWNSIVNFRLIFCLSEKLTGGKQPSSNSFDVDVPQCIEDLHGWSLLKRRWENIAQTNKPLHRNWFNQISIGELLWSAMPNISIIFDRHFSNQLKKRDDHKQFTRKHINRSKKPIFFRLWKFERKMLISIKRTHQAIFNNVRPMKRIIEKPNYTKEEINISFPSDSWKWTWKRTESECIPSLLNFYVFLLISFFWFLFGRRSAFCCWLQLKEKRK